MASTSAHVKSGMVRRFFTCRFAGLPGSFILECLAGNGILCGCIRSFRIWQSQPGKNRGFLICAFFQRCLNLCGVHRNSSVSGICEPVTSCVNSRS